MPTNTPNLWDHILKFLTDIAGAFANTLPLHEAHGLPAIITGFLAPFFWLLTIFVVFDMTIPIWTWGLITLLEGPRILYSAWMWVKRAIPFIG